MAFGRQTITNSCGLAPKEPQTGAIDLLHNQTHHPDATTLCRKMTLPAEEVRVQGQPQLLANL